MPLNLFEEREKKADPKTTKTLALFSVVCLFFCFWFYLYFFFKWVAAYNTEIGQWVPASVQRYDRNIDKWTVKLISVQKEDKNKQLTLDLNQLLDVSLSQHFVS